MINKIKALYENEPYLAELEGSDNNYLYQRAAVTNNLAVMSLLISNNFNMKTSGDPTPVSFIAAGKGSLDVLKMLFETKTSSLNDRDDYYNSTLLHVVATCNQVEVARFLLEQDGIDVNAKNKDNVTPLDRAVEWDAPLIVQMLLERDDIDINNFGSSTNLLHWACREKHLEIVKLLIQKHKVDVNLKTERHTSEPIHYVLKGGDDIAKYLLQQEGINLNGDDKYYGIPLHRACRENLVEIFELMMNVKGIDVNMASKSGETALHIACKESYGPVRNAIAYILLQQKEINVNVQDKNGNTPLHFALLARNSKIATMLLKNPAIDVNLKNEDDREPGGMYGEYKAIEEKLSRVC